MLRRLAARIFWFFSRWTLATQPGPDRPAVLLGAPHTSNWDFVLMIGIVWRLGIDVRWLGKASLFAGWRGPLMRALGGIAVDRANPAGVVEDMIRRVHAGEMFGLVVTPDRSARSVAVSRPFSCNSARIRRSMASNTICGIFYYRYSPVRANSLKFVT